MDMDMNINLNWPRKIRCVQSSSYPSDWNHNDDAIDFNAIAQHIAQHTNRTPLERMEDLLTEKTYAR